MPSTTTPSSPAALKPFDQFLLFVVRYGLFFVFIVPFIVVLSYLYPWVSGKIWGFELMVEILFPFWLILAFRRKEYRPAANAFLWAVLGYFAIATVAMLVGDMPQRSMWSKPDRLTGMFFQYHLLVFFLMASTAWRGMVSWAAAVSVTAASIAGAWGFSQSYVGASGTRGSASLGNADYLGQYLVPHLFLTAWLFWQHRSKRWFTLYFGLCGALLMLGIFSTKSRGALLGLLLAIVTGMLIAVFKGKGRLKVLSILGLVGVVALIGLYFLANRWKPAAAWLYDNRMSLQYLHETSGSRGLLITNAIRSFEARPVLGWGPENFESAYYYYYDPVTLRYSDYETRQDRPHNLVLELLVDFGIIGFLAYVAIFVFGWRLALRAEGSDGTAASLLVMASVAHLATNLFIFETPISYVDLFFILAILAVHITPKADAGEDDITPAGVPVGVIAALGMIWLMSYAVFASMRGAKITSEIVTGLSTQVDAAGADQIASLAQELKAVKTPEEERYIRTIVSNLSAGYGEYVGGPLQPVLADMVSVEATQANEQQHDYVNALVTATGEASLWPRTGAQQAALEEAVARVQRLAPNRQEVFWLLGQLATEKGDLKGAEADYQHAIDLDPASLVPKGMFAAFLLRTGQVDRAVAYLKDNWPVISPNADAAAAVSRAVLHMLDQKNNDGLLELYDQSKLQGNLPFEWAVAGALAAMDKGDFTRAQAIITDTEARFPDKAALIEKYLVPQFESAKQAASGSPSPSPASAAGTPASPGPVR